MFEKLAYQQHIEIFNHPITPLIIPPSIQSISAKFCAILKQAYHYRYNQDTINLSLIKIDNLESC